MKKLIVIFFFFVLLLTPLQAFASYDAGYSKSWPNTKDGAKAKVVAPFYKAPPNFYNADEIISLQFRIENPENNAKAIAHTLFLQIWKVEKIDADKENLTEDKLYQNHNNKKDAQSLYKTIPLGEIFLHPDESSQFATTFSISDAGYYQFDLTDLSGSTKYIPGHIYSAGFLRVKKASAKDVLGLQTHDSSIWEKILLAFLIALGITLLALLFAVLKRRREKIVKPDN